MKIWAHRGCSQRYPENTLLSFEKAAALYNKGLTGIELDIQLASDGHIVVIHDERVDRTTDGTGFVKDFSLKDLQSLHIAAPEGRMERISTIEEVLDLLEPYMKSGLRLNIELKNSVIHYENMEQMIVDIIHKRGLDDYVVYSTFYPRSLALLHKLDPDAELGMLGANTSDCYYMAKGAGIPIVLHPAGGRLDIVIPEARAVRAYFGGHLYPEKSSGRKMDFTPLEKMGVTDVFINEPEVYLE